MTMKKMPKRYMVIVTATRKPTLKQVERMFRSHGLLTIGVTMYSHTDVRTYGRRTG